jgi:hypothetical protein
VEEIEKKGGTAGAAGEKNRGQAREASDFCNKAGGARARQARVLY